MPLVLKTVPASQGLRWVRDGWRLFGRYPLAFSVLFAVFLFAALVLSLLPLLGILVLASAPLLSLGFMIASEAALGGRSPHPRHYLAAFQRDRARSLALVKMCIGYGVAGLLILLLADWVDGGSLTRLQELMAKGDQVPEIAALISSDEFIGGMLLRVGLISVLSVPYWHAPALVYWGGQGARHAFFSSTLALWRARGALLVYALAWAGLLAVFVGVTTLALVLLGLREAAGVVQLPAALIFSTVFYVSLIFTFNDSFGGAAQVMAQP